MWLYLLLFVVPQRSQAMFGILVLLTRGRRFPHAVQNNKPLNVMLIEMDLFGISIMSPEIDENAFRQQSTCTDNHA